MAFPVPALLVALPLLVIATTRLWDYVVVRLVWRPYSITKGFIEQGIHGPSYSFFKGCNEEIRSMKEKTDGLVLDVGDHKYLPRIAPHYLKWRTQYVLVTENKSEVPRQEALSRVDRIHEY